MAPAVEQCCNAAAPRFDLPDNLNGCPLQSRINRCPTLLQVASLPCQGQNMSMPAGRQMPYLTSLSLPATWQPTPRICQPPLQPLLLPLQLTAAQMMQRAASSLLQLQLV